MRGNLEEVEGALHWSCTVTRARTTPVLGKCTSSQIYCIFVLSPHICFAFSVSKWFQPKPCSDAADVWHTATSSVEMTDFEQMEHNT